MSLIEAQAGGRPIISTNVGGIENVVKKDETAILVDQNDYNEFSKELLRIIEDDQLRERLGKNSWKFVEEKFHYTRMISEMVELYNNLLLKKLKKK